MVTHYQRLLNYIVPDFVHVMEGGRIIKTGGKELRSNSKNAAMTGSAQRAGRSTGRRLKR
jgi:Fe-S cluster assembly ATP-binding protein